MDTLATINSHTTTIENQETQRSVDKFINHLVVDNALACSDFNSSNFDMEKAKRLSREGLTALQTAHGLQAMLSAQMLSIHQLQQRAMSFAYSLGEGNEAQAYYINTGVKLANCFVQQANMLAKLQGVGGQKIIVEKVDVSKGGQAVICNVNTPDRHRQN